MKDSAKKVAQLVPAAEKVCTGRQLAKVLRRAKLSSADSRAWGKDLAKSRNMLKDVTDKWQFAARQTG
jgi:hypothetical protein